MVPPYAVMPTLSKLAPEVSQTATRPPPAPPVTGAEPALALIVPEPARVAVVSHTLPPAPVSCQLAPVAFPSALIVPLTVVLPATVRTATPPPGAPEAPPLPQLVGAVTHPYVLEEYWQD